MSPPPATTSDVQLSEERSARLMGILEDYLAQLERGGAAHPNELVARHPDLAGPLKAYLASLELLHQAARSFHGSAEPRPQTDVLSTPEMGRLGDFRILREVGRGGMGVVYEAEQISLGRRVALKVLPFAGALDGKQLLRFKNEAQAAAHLQYQNIVPVYFVGCERGVHFYAMQFIDGQTLAQVIADFRLHIANLPQEASRVPKQDEATRLFAPDDDAIGNPQSAICMQTTRALSTERSSNNPAFFRSLATLGVQAALALEHAHQMGVVHRDIKPGNLLLDSHRNLWVTDFGLAQVMGDTKLTMSGDLLGTLRYMSPEQALANRVLVDHRTDLYSLGATLYELLTLEPVFAGTDRQELLRRIAFEEPQPPRRLNKSCPAELDTIVMKALEKNPADRYATAQALADDLSSFLEDKPIKAKRPTVVQRLRKFARRHRPVVVTAAAATAVLLAVVAVGATLSAIQQSDLATTAENARKETAAALVQEKEARTAADDAREKEKVHRQLAESLLERQYVTQAVRLMDDGDFCGALPWIVEGLRLVEGDAAREEMHRFRLAAALHHRPRFRQVWFHDGPVLDAEFSPDGSRVVTASKDGTARVWNTATGQPVTPPLQHDGPVVRAVFSPDGGRVLTASRDQTARIWDAASGKTAAPTLYYGGWLNHAAFSPDGARVITASADGTAQVWNVSTGKHGIPRLKHNGRVLHAAFSADGQRVVTVCHDGKVRLWDALTGKVLTSEEKLIPSFQHITTVSHAQLSPDGSRVVTASMDNTARVWQVATGMPVTPPLRHSGYVSQACFSSDGKRVATAGRDGIVHVWDAATGLRCASSLRLAGPATRVRFSPDDKSLLTASDDETARLWDLAGPNTITLKQPAYHAAFSPDGRRLATASFDGTAQVWDAVTGQPVLSTPLLHKGGVLRVAFSRDGRHLVTASLDGTARVWDPTTGKPVTDFLPHGQGGVLEAFFSPDGTQVVTACQDGMARVWEVATSRQKTTLNHRAAVVYAQFSPKGDRVLTASKDGTAQVWEVATGRTLLTLKHPHDVLQATFSADGKHVVTASGATSQVWETASGHPVGAPLKHEGTVVRACFSPDCRHVLTASVDQSARVWNAATGQPVTPPMKHDGRVEHAAFSADGRRVITASLDGSARVWDAASGAPVTPSLRDDDNVWHADFSPDGRRVVTAGSTVKIWALPFDKRPVADLVLVAQVLTGLEMRAPGQFVSLETTQFRSDWDALWSKYPHDFPASPVQEMAGWQWRRHLRRGRTHVELGQWDKALAEFTKATELAADDPRPWAERGRVYVVRGEWDKAAFDFNKAIAFAPGDSRLRRERGNVYATLGQRDKAAADYTIAIQLTPDDARVWRERANIYASLSQWDKAAADYTRAIEGTPDDPHLWVARAHIYTHRGRCEQAIADYTKAIALKADNPGPWAWRGRAHAARGQWKQAAADYDQALKLDSEDGWVWFQKACLLLEAGDSVGYRRHCSQVIDRLGQTQTAWIAHYVARSCVLAPNAALDLQRLTLLAEKGLAGYPQHAHYLNVFAAAHYRAGRYDQAIRWAHKAEKAEKKGQPWESNSARSRLFLAMAYHQLGKAGEARLWLTKAVQWLDANKDDRPRENQQRAYLWWAYSLERQFLRQEAETLILSTKR